MEITKELGQKIVNYLASKPYVEVFQLIGELQQQANASNKDSINPKEKIEKAK